MKVAALVLIAICLTLTQGQFITQNQINDLQIAIDSNYGRCCHEHHIFGVPSEIRLWLSFWLNPILSNWKNILQTWRSQGRDIWTSAFFYNQNNWQYFNTPPVSPMNHRTPYYWNTLSSTSLTPGAFGNTCQALKFLTNHMSCHDDKIYFYWIVWWSSSPPFFSGCNNSSIIFAFIQAYWKWRQCGCSGLFYIRKVSIWKLLPQKSQDEALANSREAKSDNSGRELKDIAQQIGAQYSEFEPASQDEFSRILK